MSTPRTPLSAFVVMILVASGAVFAQNNRTTRRDLLVEGQLDYFQENLKILGAVGSETVFFEYPSPDCPADDSEHGQRFVCLQPPPAQTSFDVRDIGRVTLPGNSAKNLIFEIENYSLRYEFVNLTGNPQPRAGFDFEPYFTIESAALAILERCASMSHAMECSITCMGLVFTGSIEVLLWANARFRTSDTAAYPPKVFPRDFSHLLEFRQTLWNGCFESP